MKKIIFTLFLAATLMSNSSVSVYICTGPQSKRYHKTSNCQGLKNCSRDIKKLTIKEAQDMGRTECGYCYK